MNKLDCLPAELLSLILGHVNNKDCYTCTFISKPFHSQTLPLLWRHLTIDSEEMLTQFINIMSTSSYSPGIHVRSVSITFKLSGPALLALIQLVPLLEHLTLTMATGITDTSFKHVPRHCPHLQSLAIHRGDITLLSMVALGQHCHQLATLQLKLCPYLDYAPLFSALRACPLTTVDITVCDLYRIESRHVAEAIAWSLHRHHCHLLTSLAIQNADNDYTAFISTVNTHALAWSRLRHICLDACHGMDDAMAIAFLQAHPELTSLELNGTSITDRTLDAIGICLPLVKEVRVNNTPRLTAAGICRLVKQCGTLDNGVWFAGCGIYLDDGGFPNDLNSRLYELEDVDERPEVIWLAGQRL